MSFRADLAPAGLQGAIGVHLPTIGLTGHPHDALEPRGQAGLVQLLRGLDHLAERVTLGRGHDDLVAHGHVQVVDRELVQLAALVEHDPDHSAHYRDTSSNRQNMPRRASAGSTLSRRSLPVAPATASCRS